MHLGVARLCLDCHEVHEYDHCPACTSEASAFITRWIKLDTAAVGRPLPRNSASPPAERIESYRQILQPSSSGSGASRWLRNGGLLVAAAYVARWGWRIASRQTRESEEVPKQSGAPDA